MSYLIPGLQERGLEVRLGLVAAAKQQVTSFVDGHPELKAFAEGVYSRSSTVEGRIRALCRLVARLHPAVVVVADVADAYAAIARMRRAGATPARVAMALHGIHPGYLEDVAAYCTVLDGVICSNRLTCALLADRCSTLPGRVSYAPYGVQIPSEVGRHGSSLRALRIAWVGRLEQDQKRCLDLVQILRWLRKIGIEYSLRIAGDGAQRRELEHALEEQTKLGEVEFLGKVHRLEVEKRVLHWADVLLVTSAWETGPLVAWEALARGVTLVTTRYLGSQREGALVAGENCLMFEVGDHAGAASALARAADPAVREELAAAGRRLVAGRYTIERSVRAWEDAIGRVKRVALREPAIEISQRSPAGRLDRWLGGHLGESVRALVPRRADANEQIWPFTRGRADSGAPEFWREVAELEFGVDMAAKRA